MKFIYNFIQTEIPNQVTTYWCRVRKFPDVEEIHHIIKVCLLNAILKIKQTFKCKQSARNIAHSLKKTWSTLQKLAARTIAMINVHVGCLNRRAVMLRGRPPFLIKPFTFQLPPKYVLNRLHVIKSWYIFSTSQWSPLATKMSSTTWRYSIVSFQKGSTYQTTTVSARMKINRLSWSHVRESLAHGQWVQR